MSQYWVENHEKNKPNNDAGGIPNGPWSLVQRVPHQRGEREWDQGPQG